MKIQWRDEPPTPAEVADESVIGWAFRGTFCPPEERALYLKFEAEKTNVSDRRPVETTGRGVVLEFIVYDDDDDGMPQWAMWRKHLFSFRQLRGQWCPIRA